MEPIVRAFFSSSRFSVAGASSDSTKFGNKILGWYVNRGIPVTPINARASEITVTSQDGKKHKIAAVPSVVDILATTAFIPAGSVGSVKGDGSVSLSIVTSPAVTLSILKDAHSSGIRRLWFQPGTFNQECLEYLSSANPPFELAIVPEYNRNMAVPSNEEITADLRSRGDEGWCILMDGDVGLALAKKHGSDTAKM